MATAGMFFTHTWSPRMERHFNRLVAESGGVIAWHVIRDRPDAAQGDSSETSAQAVLPVRIEQMHRVGTFHDGFLDTKIWPPILDLDADFTWYMEYDVDYAGDWAKFFDQFAANPADLLATTVLPRRKSELWPHWPLAAAPPHVSPEHMLRAFLPLMRVSRRFAHAYVEAMQDPRWGGNYEFTVPTAATAAGFVVEDIGGKGPFCPRSRRNRNYTSKTLVWRPSRDAYFVEAPESFAERGLLYHPVKGGVSEWDQEPVEVVTIVAPTKRVASELGGKQGISVALATRNGERHLRELLDSLARQEPTPDELIVCDDSSTDGTLDLLREFASNAPFSVEIVQNQRAVGNLKSLVTAVGLCHSELILFCGQDDIWLPEKIDTLRRAAAAPEAVISHDIALFSDDPAEPQIPSYFAYLSRLRLSPAFCIMGCATAVKAEFLRKWGWPRPEAEMAHGFWIGLLATAFRQRRYVDQALVKHRIDPDEASRLTAARVRGARSASKAQPNVQRDMRLLIKHGITRANLHWTDEFLRVLQERCPAAEGDAAGLRRRLDRNRARYSRPRRRIRRFLLLKDKAPPPTI